MSSEVLTFEDGRRGMVSGQRARLVADYAAGKRAVWAVCWVTPGEKDLVVEWVGRENRKPGRQALMSTLVPVAAVVELVYFE
jgi:hypothetical protein